MSKIKIHGEDAFAHMRAAGKLASQTLDFISQYVKPGVTTDELNTLCHEFITKHNAIAAPLNYNGFPKSICTSINEVVCHGIPSNRVLLNGDIINIDITVILNTWHGDTSRMFAVGNIAEAAQQLIDVTKRALEIGIEHAIIGNKTGDIGRAIESYIDTFGYSSVIDFGGHGIGQIFHDAPEILHYDHEGYDIKAGMFFTIEPMINQGTYHTKVLKDKWTVVTRDRKLSAQFEHTIGIGENGPEIFTL
jgi:methionyl aminopeptidase